MKYLLSVTRVTTDVGHIVIDADNYEEAVRKYWEPNISKGEELIFDDDIDWNDALTKYEYYVR